MATDESYCAIYDAFRKRSNVLEVYRSALLSIANEVNLGCVKVCLTLGPGDGLYEIEFLQKCAENVGNLIAVEQDRESSERLRARLRESLPNVVTTVMETDFLTWKGPEDPVDVVLLFHVLYFYGPGERLEFMRKLHDCWLADGGFVVVLSASRTKSRNSYKIFERLQSPLMPWTWRWISWKSDSPKSTRMNLSLRESFRIRMNCTYASTSCTPNTSATRNRLPLMMFAMQ